MIPRLLLAALALGLGAGCRRRSSVPARSDASPVLILAADPTSPVGALTLGEKEPNDSPAMATVFDLGTGANVVLRGALAKAADIDYVRLRFPAGPYPSRLFLEVQPALGLGVTVSVSGGGPSLSATDAKEPVARLAFPNLVAQPGEAIGVQIRAVGTVLVPPDVGLPYVVVARLGPLGGGDEREPNETLTTATGLPRLLRRPEVAGFLAPSGDVDVFRVPVAEVSTMDVILDLPDGLAAEVEILDARGGRLGLSSRTRKTRQARLRVNLPSRADGGPLNGSPDAGLLDPAVFVRIRALGGGAEADRHYTLRLSPAFDSVPHP